MDDEDYKRKKRCEKKEEMQINYCYSIGSDVFAPFNCYHCGNLVYADYSEEECSNEVVTHCRKCHVSFVE
jgi:hypothetical protein